MTRFEKKLKLLFDAQDFFRDKKLDAFIDGKTVKALTDDELEFLFAAGDSFAAVDKKSGNGDGDDKK